MWVLWAITAAIVFGISSVVMKGGTIKKYSDYYLLWGLYVSGSIFLGLSAYGQNKFEWTIPLIAMSVLVALGSFFGNYCVIKALQTGPASLTAPMLNINLPLIILTSVLYFHEVLTIMKIVIILLLFFAVLLVKYDPHESRYIKDKRWFAWVIGGSLLLFLREGGLKITLEMGLNNQIVLFFSYIICLGFSTLVLYKHEHRLNIINYKNHLNAIKYGLYAGICSGGGLLLYSKGLQTGPASIVALIFSARSLVIIFLTVLLFKEKLTKYQKISVFFLCLGLGLSSFI